MFNLIQLNVQSGLYTVGLISGMVRVLVNWWAYTWLAYIRGAYIWRFTVFKYEAKLIGNIL